MKLVASGDWEETSFFEFIPKPARSDAKKNKLQVTQRYESARAEMRPLLSYPARSFLSKFPPSSLFLSFSRRNLFPFKTVSYPPRLRINCRLFALPRVKQNASRGHQRSARKERRGARPSVADSLFSPCTSSARARSRGGGGGGGGGGYTRRKEQRAFF